MDSHEPVDEEGPSRILSHSSTQPQLSTFSLNCMYDVDSTPQIFEDNLTRWKVRVGDADPASMPENEQGQESRPSSLPVPQWPAESDEFKRPFGMHGIRHGTKISSASLQKQCRFFNTQSWEYPLTNEDKKRRLLWLSGLEMAARCDGADGKSESSSSSASMTTKETADLHLDLSNICSEHNTTDGNASMTTKETADLHLDLSNICSEHNTTYDTMVETHDVMVNEGYDSVASKSSAASEASETSALPGYLDELPDSGFTPRVKMEADLQVFTVDGRRCVKAKPKSQGLSHRLKEGAVQYGPHACTGLILGFAILGKRVQLSG